MDIFEQTFEKHKALVLEKLEKKLKITADQNVALNRLFVLLRDCLRDIKSEVGGKHFNKLSTYYKPVHDDVRIASDDAVHLYIPDHIRDSLPRLKNRLTIKIVDKDHEKMASALGAIAVAGLELKSGKVNALYLRRDILSKDIKFLEPILQHEIYHIIHQPKISGLRSEGEKIEKIISYLGDEAEMYAHAREYAYRYRKSHPEEISVDVNKLKGMFSKKEETSKIYFEFENPSKQFLDKYSPSEQNVIEMTRIYKKFIVAINHSLKYFD